MTSSSKSPGALTTLRIKSKLPLGPWWSGPACLSASFIPSAHSLCPVTVAIRYVCNSGPLCSPFPLPAIRLVQSSMAHCVTPLRSLFKCLHLSEILLHAVFKIGHYLSSSAHFLLFTVLTIIGIIFSYLFVGICPTSTPWWKVHRWGPMSSTVPGTSWGLINIWWTTQWMITWMNE